MTGGNREFAPVLGRAAVSIGIDGLFLEVHNDPDNAPSDGPNMISTKRFERHSRNTIRICHHSSAGRARHL